jgi:small-conductance mechanosensitive channel
VRTWVIAIAVLIALAILGMSLHVISWRALAVFAAAFGVLVVTTRVLGQKLR